MTNREKIEYLKQYKNLDRRINRKLEEKERWKSKAEKVTSTITDMPRGKDEENQRELAIAEMMDCEKEAVTMIDYFVDLGREIQSVIDTVENDDLRILLEYRYIDGHKWEKIAVEMNYDYQYIFELHRKAIKAMKPHNNILKLSKNCDKV
jgi:hypothetical protein